MQLFPHIYAVLGPTDPLVVAQGQSGQAGPGLPGGPVGALRAMTWHPLSS
jgi:hypothetical protein